VRSIQKNWIERTWKSRASLEEIRSIQSLWVSSKEKESALNSVSMTVFKRKSMSFDCAHTLSLSHCVAVCCSVLQCVAVCCSVLQCVAVCCSVLTHSLSHTHTQLRTSGGRGAELIQKGAHSKVVGVVWIERDLCRWKETYERDLCVWKETYESRPGGGGGAELIQKEAKSKVVGLFRIERDVCILKRDLWITPRNWFRKKRSRKS